MSGNYPQRILASPVSWLVFMTGDSQEAIVRAPGTYSRRDSKDIQENNLQ